MLPPERERLAIADPNPIAENGKANNDFFPPVVKNYLTLVSGYFLGTPTRQGEADLDGAASFGVQEDNLVIPGYRFHGSQLGQCHPA